MALLESASQQPTLTAAALPRRLQIVPRPVVPPCFGDTSAASSPCQRLQISGMISALGGREGSVPHRHALPRPPALSGRVAYLQRQHSRRQSLPPTAGLLSGPLMATWPKPRQPYLPKLPSEAACVCLSPPNILSPFGLAWRKKRSGKKQKNKKQKNKSNQKLERKMGDRRRCRCRRKEGGSR